MNERQKTIIAKYRENCQGEIAQTAASKVEGMTDAERTEYLRQQKLFAEAPKNAIDIEEATLAQILNL